MKDPHWGVKVTSNCPVCNGEIILNTTGRPRIYCGWQCRGKAHRSSGYIKKSYKEYDKQYQVEYMGVAANRERVNKNKRSRRALNLDATREKDRANYKLNPSRRLENGRLYRKKYPDKAAAMANSYKERFPELYRLSRSKCTKKIIEKLSDGYVAKIMGLPVALIPDCMIAARRSLIIVRRLLKNENTK